MTDVEAATAAPGEKRSASRSRKLPGPAPDALDAPGELAKAAESGNPEVQYLLAVRQAANQNDDQDAAEWASAELAKLGFE
jgi:hypothetical protein